jgi:hypothetical protein
MPNFPAEDQERLLDLQELDTAADTEQSRLARHPARARVDELEAEAATVAAGTAQVRRELGVAEQAVADAERRAAELRTRRNRDQQRLDAGSVSNPRELEHLQHEVQTLGDRLAEVEDVELAAMEEVETLEAQVAALEAEAERLRDELGAVRADLADAEQRGAAVRADLASRREVLVAELPGPLVDLYERVRAQRSGVGAARLVHGRCEGCRLELTGRELAHAASAPPDEVLRCEECGRILVRGRPDRASGAAAGGPSGGPAGGAAGGTSGGTA